MSKSIKTRFQKVKMQLIMNMTDGSQIMIELIVVKNKLKSQRNVSKIIEKSCKSIESF